MSMRATSAAMPWGAFLARTLVAGVVVCGAAFIGVKLASADPGGPPTRNAFTFAGVLRNADGGVTTTTTPLTFIFHRAGQPDCTPPVVMATPNASGAFSVLVPIDSPSCTGTFFNGADITYDVLQGTEPLTPDGGVAVNPVPYARFADQVGVNNDCPSGYQTTTNPAFTGDMRLCQRRRNDGTAYDEVVRVGLGASSFWIDRYEASIWDNRQADGTQYGVSRDDYDVGGRSFPDNGVWATPLFASSRQVPLSPSRFVTWFQAQAACRLAGKRLPTRDEWIAAANGSPDSADLCRINNPVGGTRNTGGSSCVSRWGAEDMVGNVWEWTDEWFAGTGSHPSDPPDAGVDSGVPGARARWPSGFNNDTVLGAFSYVIATNGDFVRDLPAAAVRGGDYGNADGAGVFALEIAEAPSAAYSSIGFRCVVPR